MKKLFLILLLLVAFKVHAQYERAVISLPRLNYVYYNLENPIEVAVPGLMPKDLLVTVGDEKATLHRDPDGSCVTDLVLRPKDSTGTIVVHVAERMENQRHRSRGMVRFRVITMPDPELYLGYIHSGDTIGLDDIKTKSYIQVKAKLEDFVLPVDEPQVLCYDINRTESFRPPIHVEGSKLTSEVIEMIQKARRDETIYIDRVKVLQPDGRIVTLSGEFPLK